MFKAPKPQVTARPAEKQALEFAIYLIADYSIYTWARAHFYQK
jgi:hypothetical protein